MKRVCYIVTITLVVLSFQNCDSFHSLSEKDAEEFSSRAILEVNQELQSQSLAILNSRCASCHDRSSSGGVTHILDVYHLVSSALIIPGDSSRGRLLGSIRDSSMPPGSALASQDLQTLEAWVDSMKLVEEVPPETHGPVLAKDFSLNSYASLKARATKSLSECQSGQMPESPYPQLTAEELAAFSAWIQNGALDS